MEDAGLLAAIRADRDADAPRLIYADWLDDNHEPERAAFIRAQVELAALPPDSPEMPPLREIQAGLLKKHIAAWSKSPGRWGRVLEWHRGFPRTMAIDAGQFARHHPLIFEEVPTLEGAQFRGSTELRSALDSAGVERLRGVSLASQSPDPSLLYHWFSFGACRHLSWIDLSSNGWTVEQTAGAVCGMHEFLRLDSVDLSGNLTEADQPEWLCLNHASLSRIATRIHVADPQPPLLRGVAQLDEFRVKPSDRLLREEDELGTLAPFVTHLDLSNVVADLDIWAAVGLADWPKLCSVDLSYSRFYLTEAALARAAELPRLAELNLQEHKLGDAGLNILTASPLWPKLTSLGLANNGLTDRAAKALIAARPTSRLLTLDLSYNTLSASAAALREAYGPGVCLFNESRELSR